MSKDIFLEGPTNCSSFIDHLYFTRDWQNLPEGYGIDVELIDVNDATLPICSRHTRELGLEIVNINPEIR